MDNRQKIGEMIRKKRLLLGMTQEQLAQKLGYKTRVSIARIENGVVSVPKEKLEQFAKELNCNVEELRQETKTINDNVSHVNIDLTYPNTIAYSELIDDDFNDLLLKIWFKYTQEQKSLVNDIDKLVMEFYELRNAIKKKNNTYHDIWQTLDNMSASLVATSPNRNAYIETLNKLIEDSKDKDIETLLNEFENL